MDRITRGLAPSILTGERGILTEICFWSRVESEAADFLRIFTFMDDVIL